MCGITGIVTSAACDPRAVEEQLASIRHRGPDAEGSFAGARGVVGQTRLAIIDLVTGDPPLTEETAQIGAVLNGEIYNHRTLRNHLIAGGHRLRSLCDTEVLAHLAEDSSPVELAQSLEGMFAFAVWDARRERLVLGRDRVGKKPLYYWYGDGRLVFGSEIKAVLANANVPRALDPDAISAYVRFGYVPTPRTFFEGVISLPPGHVLTFEPGGTPIVERYWDLPIGEDDGVPADVTFQAAATGVRQRLEAAVERRLMSDVPIGAFLSGGMDSSVIVALMSRLSGERVRTFTIGFEDSAGFDERPFAQYVSELYRTDHHEYVVNPSAVDLVEKLLWHYDQPFGDSSAIPTHLVSEVTRQDVTVALSGDGGDELFGGYERFAAALALRRYRALPIPVRRATSAAVGRLNPSLAAGRVESLQRFTANPELSLLDAYRSWISFMSADEHRRALGIGDDWASQRYADIWRSSSGSDTLTRLLSLNLKTYLVDDLLVKTDRMSMAHGLEIRSPFLDTALTEFAFRLPSKFKLHGFRRKRVLAAAAADLLPPQILNRRKRGFAVPLDRWFRGELKPLLDARLGSPGARLRTHLDGTVIDGVLGEHASGARNRGQALWMLLMLELFLRREQW
jgi:asparagine synthase (glutamine-hydrolysing)